MTDTTAVVPALDLPRLLSEELRLPLPGITAVLRLLDEGSTVPFIARYRKEATGSLDEVAIRAIQQRAAYLKDLDERRRSVLKSIAEQGKLTPELEAQILAATTKAALEDLYLPFRPKRRTRAMVAREQGLEPLANRILEQPVAGDPQAEAAAFVNAEKGVADAAAALQGARDIVAEAISESAPIRRGVRDQWYREAVLVSERVETKAQQPARPTKFDAYHDFKEAVGRIPSHRFLAVRRGEQEGALRVHLEADESRLLPKIEAEMKLDQASPFAGELRAAVADGYRRLIQPSIETELRVELKQRSDELAVGLFAENLRDLLLAPPLGERSVVGVDPGIRSGCKCAAVDSTGRFLASTTIHPLKDETKAKAGLARFLLEHKPSAIAVGNGTHGRETLAFVRKVVTELAAEHAELPELKATIVSSVNEAGASVYSASELARAELPKQDVTVRGAVSIARRMQDPLAELVKIDPKSIGVGQYQHDVHAPMLGEKLDEVVESCVNQVGVELNTASAPLLARVAGIGPSLAGQIVRHREEKGAFKGRRELLDVGGLGPKTFEQCAGFLRIRAGEHPLDASAVHPERYELVERIAADVGAPVKELVGSAALAEKVDVKRYVGGDVGEPTLLDILEELKKPGRDPRRAFEPPHFREDVTKPEDLKVGMTLEGVVTNVTAFGAFVDVGVHQDGLVHVSRLADRFVKDPREVVKVGDRIEVRVVEVDLERKRIALTAKKEQPKPEPRAAAATAPRSGSFEAGAGAQAPPRPRRDARDGDGRDRRGPPRGRDREHDRAPPRLPSKPPAPRPLTPQDAQKQGRNNPLGNLLKGLFDKST
jgi:uncharacterized protein